MKRLHLLAWCWLLASVLHAASTATLIAPYEIKNDNLQMTLPKGCKLEVVSEKDGTLTCIIANQVFQIPVDKTDFQPIAAADPKSANNQPEGAAKPANDKPSATSKPSYSTATNLLDLPGATLNPNELAYSLHFMHNDKNVCFAVPKNYDKHAGNIPVGIYTYTLVDGTVAEIEIITGCLTKEQAAAIGEELKTRYPLAKGEQITESLNHGFPTLFWYAAEKSATERLLVSFNNFMPDTKNRFRYKLKLSNTRGAGRLNVEEPADYLDLQFAISVHEVPRELALSLQKSQALRTDAETIDKIMHLRKRLALKAVTETKPSKWLSVSLGNNAPEVSAKKFCIANAKNGDDMAEIHCMTDWSEPEKNLLWMENASVWLAASDKSKFAQSQYISFSPGVLEIGRTTAIPLASYMDGGLSAAYFPVALITPERK
ncbi:MAG: hypothetical protein LBH01_08490 [Verrucomicrobiales bacterium]|jgi:hypothetical protein|nr:hypothetical protein [Verrucomicrobiales bacterium]